MTGNPILKENTMASTTTAMTPTRHEDVLAHLPASRAATYKKGEIIYGLDTSPRSIYLVITGKAVISYSAEDGTHVLLDIVRPDELFGESAFQENARRSEVAEAIETTEVMSWTVTEMESLITKRPRLAVALLQVLAQRNVEYVLRIESFSTDSIAQRLARSLLRFSQRLGTQEEGGSVSMIPLTHEMLSRYVGTSREIITHHMNEFRKHGYVTYSRRGINLHSNTLKAVLD
jgi:CRP/FNR family cyclic AMP-dependent transcriptional regulator